MLREAERGMTMMTVNGLAWLPCARAGVWGDDADNDNVDNYDDEDEEGEEDEDENIDSDGDVPTRV